MSDFFRSSSSTPSPALSGTSAADMNTRKEALKAQVRSELALSNAQNLINTINEKCFEKCITKPSSSLSGSEETCLSRCMERYMEAFDLVSRTYTARLTREKLERL